MHALLIHNLYIKDLRIVRQDTLTMLTIDPLKVNNAVNVFLNQT